MAVVGFEMKRMYKRTNLDYGYVVGDSQELVLPYHILLERRSAGLIQLLRN
jgi:hypothetical protein